MILPDEHTPPGTPCWVRDKDSQEWVERKFLRAEKCGSFNWVTQFGICWFQCRLDDPNAPKLPEGFTPCNGRPEGLADEDVVAVILRDGSPGWSGKALTALRWNWKCLNAWNDIIGYKLIKKALAPHVHHDLIVQWAADPSLKVWRLRSDGVWILLEGQPLWRDYEKYHIGETPPPPEPRMITIEGHTFAAPSPVQTETHTCGLADALWIRQQDVAAYLAAKDALMDRAIKEQLK